MLVIDSYRIVVVFFYYFKTSLNLNPKIQAYTRLIVTVKGF